MHLSLLSEGYVSDSFNDAGPIVMARRATTPPALHFVALCRGLIVLLALALPVGITLLAKTIPVAADQQETARSTAPHGTPFSAKNG